MSYEIDEEAVAAALAKIKVSTGGALPEPPPMGTDHAAQRRPRRPRRGHHRRRRRARARLCGGIRASLRTSTVAILSRSAENMEKGRRAVEAAGGRAVVAAVDVRDPGQIAAAFDKVESEVGPDRRISEQRGGKHSRGLPRILRPRAFKAVMGIVLEGAYYCSREFARRAIPAGRPGAILNIGAHTVWTGGPGQALSAAAKAGAQNLTLVPFGGVGAITAYASTRWCRACFRRTISQDRCDGVRSSPRRAFLTAANSDRLQELAWAATYLCSPFANYITGAVSGGGWRQLAAARTPGGRHFHAGSRTARLSALRHATSDPLAIAKKGL